LALIACHPATTESLSNWRSVTEIPLAWSSRAKTDISAMTFRWMAVWSYVDVFQESRISISLSLVLSGTISRSARRPCLTWSARSNRSMTLLLFSRYKFPLSTSVHPAAPHPCAIAARRTPQLLWSQRESAGCSLLIHRLNFTTCDHVRNVDFLSNVTHDQPLVPLANPGKTVSRGMRPGALVVHPAIENPPFELLTTI